MTPLTHIIGFALLGCAAVFAWCAFLIWLSVRYNNDWFIFGGLFATMIFAGFALLLAGCGESTPLADLAPATIGIPIGHTPSSRTYAAWCGATCRCNVTVNQDCADDAVWLAEGTPPMPNSPYQAPGRITPLACATP